MNYWTVETPTRCSNLTECNGLTHDSYSLPLRTFMHSRTHFFIIQETLSLDFFVSIPILLTSSCGADINLHSKFSSNCVYRGTGLFRATEYTYFRNNTIFTATIAVRITSTTTLIHSSSSSRSHYGLLFFLSLAMDSITEMNRYLFSASLLLHYLANKKWPECDLVG